MKENLSLLSLFLLLVLQQWSHQKDEFLGVTKYWTQNQNFGHPFVELLFNFVYNFWNFITTVKTFQFHLSFSNCEALGFFLFLHFWSNPSENYYSSGIDSSLIDIASLRRTNLLIFKSGISIQLWKSLEMFGPRGQNVWLSPPGCSTVWMWITL